MLPPGRMNDTQKCQTHNTDFTSDSISEFVQSFAILSLPTPRDHVLAAFNKIKVNRDFEEIIGYAENDTNN